jgi:hypothetical protein
MNKLLSGFNVFGSPFHFVFASGDFQALVIKIKEAN